MSINNILSKLKDINNSNLVSVYVPSADKFMNFRPLSVKQQKDLIKSGLDGALAGVTISNIISDIIISNSVEKYNFLVTDKFPILLSLRRQSFGNLFKYKEDEKEIVVDLDKILEKQLKYSYKPSADVSLDETDVIASVDVVGLEEDIRINNVQLEKLKKNKDEDLSEMVGSLFIYEIVKFITKITVNNEELDLTKLPIKDRLTVVENIPATLNNSILSYIQQFRKEETEYITVDGVVMPIDARLFAKE